MVSGMSGLRRRTLGENISIETIQSGGLWVASADINQLENISNSSASDSSFPRSLARYSGF
jgi:hypothetical protein